jgi:hypothetical protein
VYSSLISIGWPPDNACAGVLKKLFLRFDMYEILRNAHLRASISRTFSRDAGH